MDQRIKLEIRLSKLELKRMKLERKIQKLTAKVAPYRLAQKRKNLVL